MSQIVLSVPPEVIQLLMGIRSSLQRLEQEVRECRLRLGWEPRPASTTPAAALPRRQEPETTGAPRKAGRSVHTPAGPTAAKRMQALRDMLRLSAKDMGGQLRISTGMVYYIERGKCGISVRVDQAMKRLEGGSR